MLSHYDIEFKARWHNQAISQRLSELLKEKEMTQHKLYTKSDVPKSTIGNVINCAYDSIKLRVIHEMCQGLEIGVAEFSVLRCLKKTI